MEELNYSVYVHVSPDGKKYIGITKQNLYIRWHNGKGYKGNKYFFRAIEKYGWDGLSHFVLASALSKCEAEQIEIDLIKEHKTNNRDFGYNIENGGNCCGTHSEETRRKIGAKSKGNKNCAGRVISEWHKQKMIDGGKLWRQSLFNPETQTSGLSGESNFFYGKHHSEKTKKMISDARKACWQREDYRNKMMENAMKRDISGEKNPMFGRTQSEETRKKISERLKGKPLTEENAIRLNNLHKKARKKVLKLSLDNELLCEYDCMFMAADDVNGNSQNIGFACRHLDRTYKGFYWRYSNDDNG